MAQRYETNFPIMGTKSLRKELVSTLIGKGGGNIRKVRNEVGNKTFIKFYNMDYGLDKRAKVEECDTVYISSNSEISVRKASKKIKTHMQNIISNNHTTEINQLVRVDPKSVGTIIGFKGRDLESIMKIGGPNCYIVHKKEFGGFVVTCNTKDELEKVKDEILKRQNEYLRNQRNWNKAKTPINNFMGNISKNTTHDNAYNNIKNENKIKWQIREELSKKRNSNGDYCYPDYETLDKYGNIKRFQGKYAVPWSEVNIEYQRRQESIAEKQLMKVHGLKDMDKWEPLTKQSTKITSNKGVWAECISSKVLEPKSNKITLKIKDRKTPSSRSKVRKSLENTRHFGNNDKLISALGDLASEQSRIRREEKKSNCSWGSESEDDLPPLAIQDFNWEDTTDDEDY